MDSYFTTQNTREQIANYLDKAREAILGNQNNDQIVISYLQKCLELCNRIDLSEITNR